MPYATLWSFLAFCGPILAFCWAPGVLDRTHLMSLAGREIFRVLQLMVGCGWVVYVGQRSPVPRRVFRLYWGSMVAFLVGLVSFRFILSHVVALGWGN